MAKITNPEVFQEQWNAFIPTMTKDDINKYIGETSPQYPNENMRWLYDRLLGELHNA